jgi:hypothetical protein
MFIIISKQQVHLVWEDCCGLKGAFHPTISQKKKNGGTKDKGIGPNHNFTKHLTVFSLIAFWNPYFLKLRVLKPLNEMDTKSPFGIWFQELLFESAIF